MRNVLYYIAAILLALMTLGLSALNGVVASKVLDLPEFKLLTAGAILVAFTVACIYVFSQVCKAIQANHERRQVLRYVRRQRRSVRDARRTRTAERIERQEAYARR